MIQINDLPYAVTVSFPSDGKPKDMALVASIYSYTFADGTWQQHYPGGA